MKFFVDENSHLQIADVLKSIYREHSFRTFAQEGLSGYEDMALFRVLARRNFDAIITADRNQLQVVEEKEALIRSGLHWIGHRRVELKGMRGVLLTVAGVVAGFPFVMDAISGTSGQKAFLIQRVPSDFAQRVKVLPL